MVVSAEGMRALAFERSNARAGAATRPRRQVSLRCSCARFLPLRPVGVGLPAAAYVSLGTGSRASFTVLHQRSLLPSRPTDTRGQVQPSTIVFIAWTACWLCA